MLGFIYIADIDSRALFAMAEGALFLACRLGDGKRDRCFLA
jgi:hypothetical protein